MNKNYLVRNNDLKDTTLEGILLSEPSSLNIEPAQQPVTNTISGNLVSMHGYSRATIQIINTTGTPTVQIKTSIDGVNWFLEAERNSGDMISLEGKAGYVTAEYVTGDGDVLIKFLLGN